MVVYHHYMQRVYDFHYTTVVGQFFSTVGQFGVDIFFVISGFIMFYALNREAVTAFEFMLRRVLRIVPLYWFMTLAFMLISLLIPSSAGQGGNIASFALSLLFIPHENPSGIGLYPLLTVGWTLNFEMFFYLFLGLMLLVFRRTWFAACAIAMLVLPLSWGRQWPYASILTSSLLYEFVFGMTVGYLFLKGRRRSLMRMKWHSQIIGALFLLAGVSIYWASNSGWQIANFDGILFFWRLGNLAPHLAATALVCAALLYENSFSRLRALPLLRHLGDISYSTYLVHPISLVIILKIFGHPASLLQQFLTISAYTYVTMMLGHLSYRWIETGPVMGSLKRKLLSPRNIGNVTNGGIEPNDK